MSRQDELERYERLEASDLIRLLEASRPQGNRRAPPDFGMKVLSRIEAKCARRGFFSQLSDAWTPTWAPAAVAALLALSLGFNVWLGVEMASPPAIAQAAMKMERPMRAHVFQQGIRDDANLGALVAAQQTAPEPTWYGFADVGHTNRPTFFRLGAWYAEALAFLRSGDLKAATQRWQTLDRALGQTAEPLLSYRRHMQSALQHEPPALAQFQTWLPLFESFYEVEATRGRDQALLLFQAGSWMTNMRLAAMAGDIEGLRRDPAMSYFITHLNVPKGVERGLERLRKLLAKRTLSERDLKTVDKLVQNMQQLLG